MKVSVVGSQEVINTSLLRTNNLKVLHYVVSEGSWLMKQDYIMSGKKCHLYAFT